MSTPVPRDARRLLSLLNLFEEQGAEVCLAHGETPLLALLLGEDGAVRVAAQGEERPVCEPVDA